MKIILAILILASGVFLTACGDDEKAGANRSEASKQLHEGEFKNSSQKSYTVGSIKEDQDK